jgi:hypothetical protein
MASLVYTVERLVRQIERILALGDMLQMRRNYAASRGRLRAYHIHNSRLQNLVQMLEPLVDEYVVLCRQLRALGLNHRHVNLN